MSIHHLGEDRYQVRLYNPVGREYRKVIHGKRAAIQHEAEMRMRIAGGLNPANRKTTFRAYCEQHLESRALRASTRSRYERNLERHFYPAIGHRRIGAIRYTDLLHLLATWQRLAVSTQRDYISTLKMLFRAAELDGFVDRSPAAALTMPRPVRREKFIPTMQQARLMSQATRSRPTGFAIQVAALTGMRASEISGLAVEDLDMLRGLIHVRRQYLHHDDGWWYYDDPKTPQSARSIPIPPVLVDDLAAYLAAYPPTPTTAPWQQEDGRPVTHNLILPFSVKDRVQQLTIRRPNISPGYGPHALRHMYTALLENAGVPLTAIDEVTGHRTQGITLGVYSRPTDESRQRVREVTQHAWLQSAADTGQTARRA